MESTKTPSYVYDFETTSITSYAQNFEDVLLRRALRDVTNGFYIDIGAQDPRVDSVSRGFYELGWRGLSVEPTLQYTERLRQDRPDETILHAAVSDQPGMLRFFPIPDTGSSTASIEIAAHARATGWAVQETTVAALTLDQIFDGVEPEKEIHWLKIDVEGFERQVIEGWRASKRRPWIIVMEAINPIDRSDSSGEWEPLLLAKGYQFVHFDSINRYYLAQKHKHRKVYFKYGASLWDNFQLPESSFHAKILTADRAEWATKAAQAELALENARSELNSVRQRADALQAEWGQKCNQVDELLTQIEAARSELRAAEQRERRAQITVTQLSWAREELDGVTRELGETAAALSHASFKLENERSARAVQQTTLSALEAELEAARSALAEEADNLSKARSELSQSRNSLAQAELEFAQARSELDATRADRDGRIADLDQAYDEMVRTRTERDQALADLDSALADLQRVRFDIEKLQSDLAAAGNELAMVHADRDLAWVELEGARTELNGAHAALDSALADLQRVRFDIEKLQSDLAAAGNELAMVHADRDLAWVELEGARTELNGAHAALDATLIDLSQSRDEMKRSRAAMGEVSQTLAENQATLARTRQDLNQARGELAVTERKLSDAQSALVKAESNRVEAESAANDARALALRRDAEAGAQRRTRVGREVALRLAASRFRWRIAVAFRGSVPITNVLASVPIIPPVETGGAPDPELSVRSLLGREMEDFVDRALTELDAVQQREAARLWPLRRLGREPILGAPTTEASPESVVRQELSCEGEALVQTAFLDLKPLRKQANPRLVRSWTNRSDQPEGLMRAALGCAESGLLLSARQRLPAVAALPGAWNLVHIGEACATGLAPDEIVRERLGLGATGFVSTAQAGLHGLVRFDDTPPRLASAGAKWMSATRHSRRHANSDAYANRWSRNQRSPAKLAPIKAQLGASIGPSEAPEPETTERLAPAWSIRGRGPNLGGGLYMAPQVANSLRQMDLGIVEESTTDEDSAGLVINRLHLAADNVRAGAILAGFDCGETGYPAVEIDRFNNEFEGVACVSKHAAKILVDQGLTIPISIAGLGLDQWESLVPRAGFHAPGKRFCFLHVSQCRVIDGIDALIVSFARTFRSDDDVSLIIKPEGPVPPDLTGQLERMRASIVGFPDVVVIEAPLSDHELKSLYLQCQVLVAAGRAQGFCLPLAQALVCEIPVVATGWGGHTDYCDDLCGWRVEYSFQRARSDQDLAASVWVEPDPGALDQALRQAYTAAAEERTAKGRAGRKKVLDAYSWSKVMAAIVDLAHSEPKSAAANATVAVMTSWNVQCGIASHVANMLAGVREDEVLILAGRETKVQLAPDGPNVIRAWDLRKEINNLDNILPELKRRGITRLLVQFNYGFFNFNEFRSFLDTITDDGIIVFVDFHSTVDAPFAGPDGNFLLSTLAPALRKCHRLMVHGPADFNRLKALGSVENVMLFPLGVVSSSQPLRQSGVLNDPPLLMTFGFAFPNKGLPEIVDAVGILRDRGVSVRLIMLNAEHPIPASGALLNSVRAKIDHLKLSDRVELRSEYLPEDVCLGLLSEADLIVNPYQESGESASAAIRYSLATSRPVAVTPLAIFDDLGGAAFRLPGTSPSQIATGIIEALTQIRDDTDVAVAVQRARDQWLEVHSVERQASRLLRMIRSVQDMSVPSGQGTRNFSLAADERI